MPELAASIVAARKGQHDIAIGNVVGSNMFNLLAVAGIAGFISPMSHINPDVLVREWPMLMILTIGLFLMAFGYGHQGQISRRDGVILLGSFVAYNGYLLSVI
ncbi:MAG: cation:H+ antiporter [Arenicella sp.]